MMRKLINPFQVKSFGLWIIVLLGLPNSTHARNIFYNDNYKTSITTILTDQKNSICENGFLYAFNGSWVLRKWHAKTELCYKVDTNKRLVILKDPSKLIFSSSQIPTESFVYIPSAQEKAAQEDANRRAANTRNLEQIIRNNIQFSNQPQLESNSTPLEENGIRTLMLNGDLKTCIKTGPMLDCD
jgi:hypothetical protein